MGEHKFRIDSRGRAASVDIPAETFKAWNDRKGFQVTAAREKMAKAIYTVFQDKFDFIFFVMNNKERPTTLPFMSTRTLCSSPVVASTHTGVEEACGEMCRRSAGTNGHNVVACAAKVALLAVLQVRCRSDAWERIHGDRWLDSPCPHG